MADVFISYSHNDRDFARFLRDELVARQKTVWIDEEDIPPASRWATDLKRAVEEADSFVFVVSPDSARSPECRKELEHAAGLNKRIIPVRHRAVPEADLLPSLAQTQFVPARGLFDDDHDASVALLVSAIETDLDWVTAHTAWGRKAIEWDEHTRDVSFLLSGSELGQAEQWLAGSSGKKPEPTALQKEYVNMSRQRATRRQRTRLTAVSIALVVALVLAAVALVQRASAIRNDHVAQSRSLASEAERTLATYPQKATALSLQGLGIDDTTQAQQALRDALPSVQVLKTWSEPGGADVTDAAFSPNGKEFIATAQGGSARIVDTADLATVHVLHEPTHDAITEGSFSPDGSEVVTVGNDGWVRVFNAQSGRPITAMQVAPPHTSDSATFNPQGGQLITTGDDQVTVYDLPSGKAAAAPFQVDGGAIPANAALNASSTELAVTTASGFVELYNINAGTTSFLPPLSDLESQQPNQQGYGLISDAAFSPDGTEVAFAAGDGTARVYNVASGQLVSTIASVGAPVLSSIAFSPNGNDVVTAGHDGDVQIWQAYSGRPLLTLAGHVGDVNSAAFSPDGTEVMTAGSDGTVKLWDATPREARSELIEPGTGGFINGSFSPNGSQLVTSANDGTVRIWDARTGQSQRTITLSSDALATTVTWAPDGHAVLGAAALAANSATIWNASTGHVEHTFSAPGGAGQAHTLLSAVFSPDGKEVATASEDGTVRMWDVANGKDLYHLTDAKGSIDWVAFNASGSEFVTANSDGRSWIVSTRTGKIVRTLTMAGRSEVMTAAFSRDGSTVLTATADGRATLWNVPRGRRRLTITIPGGADVNSAEFSPDGSMVVTASDDGTTRVFDAHSGDELTVLGSEGGGSIVYATFNTAGTAILSCNENGVGPIWSSELTRPLSGLLTLAEQRAEPDQSAAQRSRTYKDLQGLT